MKTEKQNKNAVFRTVQSKRKYNNLSFVDNRATTHNQETMFHTIQAKNKMSSQGIEGVTQQKHNVLQRIIVVEDSQLDYGMIVNIYQMLKNGIDSRVTLLSILCKSDIRNEQIGLQGHGYGPTGKYANLNEDFLIDKLLAGGVDDTNVIIDFLSCQTGKGDVASYAGCFAEKIFEKTGIHRTVYANKGLAVTMKNGYNYSKRERNTEEQNEYNRIIQVDYVEEVEKAKALEMEFNMRLNQDKENLDEGKVKALIMEYGVKILREANHLFEEVYKHQSKLLASHGDSDYGIYKH